jgi:hypothetical protein
MIIVAVLERAVSLPNEEIRNKTLEQLCEEASHETDTQRLLALTQEIDRLLEQKEQQRKSSAA